jgi:hypothetical protein
MRITLPRHQTPSSRATRRSTVAESAVEKENARLMKRAAARASMDPGIITRDSTITTPVLLEVLAEEAVLTTTVDQAAVGSEAEVATADREAGTKALIPITMGDHLHSHGEDPDSRTSTSYAT